MRLRILFIISLTAFTQFADAQYKLLFEKPVQIAEEFQQAENITGISPLDGGMFIMFHIWDMETQLPAFAFIDKNDHVCSARFIDIDSFDNIEMVGAVRKSPTQVRVMGNDFTNRGDGKPIPMPVEFVLDKSVDDTVFRLLNVFRTTVTDLKDDKSFGVVDNAADDNNGNYMSIVKRTSNNSTNAFIYAILPNEKVRNASFNDCDDAKIWFADKNILVASTETIFNNNRSFYQVHIMDHNFNIIQSYPSKDKSVIQSLMKEGVKDRLIRCSYRPVHNVGFVTRQMINENHENTISWYTFNGLASENSVFTQVGIKGNVQTAYGPVLPANEEVIIDGELHTGGSQLNNMVVALDRNGTGHNHDLALTVADYYGLETSREIIKEYVDSSLTVVKAWTNDNNQLYVVANTLHSISDGNAGLYISKWEATPDAINNTLYGLKSAKGWKTDPFYSRVAVFEDKAANYMILDIDSSDPNYSKKNDLIGKSIKIESAGITPLRGSYWFKGTIKVGRKTYEMAKFAIMKG